MSKAVCCVEVFTELSHLVIGVQHQIPSTRFSTVSLTYIMCACTYILIHNVLAKAVCCYFSRHTMFIELSLYMTLVVRV